jgi:hypothetical protein
LLSKTVLQPFKTQNRINAFILVTAICRDMSRVESLKGAVEVKRVCELGIIGFFKINIEFLNNGAYLVSLLIFLLRLKELLVFFLYM